MQHYVLFCELIQSFVTGSIFHNRRFNDPTMFEMIVDNDEVVFKQLDTGNIISSFLVCDTNDEVSTHIRLDRHDASKWKLVENNVYECIGNETVRVIAIAVYKPDETLIGSMRFIDGSIPRQFTCLNLCVQDCSDELQQLYVKRANEHNYHTLTHLNEYNAGFDLLAPADQFNLEQNRILDYNVSCSATSFQIQHDNDEKINSKIKFECSASAYYLYPRSSISTTNLRLANCQGIIDAGYRGHLKAAFDIYDRQESATVNKHQRLVQLCSPQLSPLLVKVVYDKDVLGNTMRNDGGFGSTGI